MGLFGKLFSSEKDSAREEISKIPWYDLENEAEVKELSAASEKKLIVIFKHSTRCGISRMALRKFEREYDLAEDVPVRLYYLDLIKNRAVSNAVAEEFNVHHESPQLIILKNKQVAHQASHQDINVESLKNLL